MDKIWSKLYAEARAVLKPRKVSGIIEAGGVGGHRIGIRADLCECLRGWRLHPGDLCRKKCGF